MLFNLNNWQDILKESREGKSHLIYENETVKVLRMKSLPDFCHTKLFLSILFPP